MWVNVGFLMVVFQIMVYLLVIYKDTITSVGVVLGAY